nr:immunoglobulin light chain junction region [Macaca mulatta]MOV94645.1 immunoglobulin light chain junction region [Macaca mulatta]MOV95286.1 immunoglobulin light chain junction region [Macaca mulatta]MOV95747.1 immunoglobulin light chain junction region [Macaca mulatta]MOV96375.1 immunoglobulin light chain junction region [Macaca mulatta]
DYYCGAWDNSLSSDVF